MQRELELSKRVIFHIILWGFLVPQVTLVLLNLYSWQLIGSEANREEVLYAAGLFAGQLTLLGGSLFALFLHCVKSKPISWKTLLFSLIAHMALMWILMFVTEDAIPNSIQPWILSEGNVGRWSITLLMPGAFLSLYGLTRITFGGLKQSTSNLLVLTLSLGVPVFWYVLVATIQPLWFGQITIVITIILTTIAATVFLAAVIRFFDNMIHKESTGKFAEKHYVLATLLGLAGPLAGLQLNKALPFPADLQVSSVYLFTVINGLILLVKPGSTKFISWIVFLRCATLPFAFYFFLVFLPFLPLSLFAIIAVGTGLLMLTPLALGLFQANITYRDFKHCQESVGKRKTMVIGIIGVLIIPSYFISQAVLDKQALHSSLDYFYAHDMNQADLSNTQRKRASEALVQLKNRKSNAQLPYISGIYNTIVFGNLVLPDKKIEWMYHLMNNEHLPQGKNDLFGSRHRSFRGPVTVGPERDVTIQSYSVDTIGDAKRTVRLILQNNTTSTHSLFVGDIHISEGLFVEGLRLKIEDQWEHGRFFDRKTALWVFQKITEVRRDPALLYYTSPQTLELRVYPFPGEGIREVEIDFHIHPNINAQITIAEETINLNPLFNKDSLVLENGHSVDKRTLSDYGLVREPYLHFILDFSKGSEMDAPHYGNRVAEIASEFGIRRGKISAANFSVSDPSLSDIFNLEDQQAIQQNIDQLGFSYEGALWTQQAIAKAIVETQNSLSTTNLYDVPIFIVLSDVVRDGQDIDVRQWSDLIPDMSSWYLADFKHLTEYPIQKSTKKVLALRNDKGIVVLPSRGSNVVHHAAENLSVFDPTDQSFSPFSLTKTFEQNPSTWSTYASVWGNWKQASLNPADLERERQAIHSASKAHHLLLPETSLIVVESESQWEMLKRKEKQSLNNHSSLEFDEQNTSEPPWWLLLGALLMYLFIKHKIRLRGLEA